MVEKILSPQTIRCTLRDGTECDKPANLGVPLVANDTIVSDLKIMSHLEIFQTIKQVKMHTVRVIATMLMMLVLAVGIDIPVPV